jgi:preprotein translocase subunit YajC
VPSAFSPILMMLLMFAVFYFILIRPQVKKQREHQSMLSKLDKGDMIVTRGGLVGKIAGVTDTVLTIELQEKVRVRVLRSHIDGKYQPSSSAPAASDKKAA